MREARFPDIASIPNPCTKRTWDGLSGNGSVRYCEDCATHVHDVSCFTEVELAQIRAAQGGKLCGYLNATIEVHRSRRSILWGALLSAASPLFGQDGIVKIIVVDQTGAVIPRATVARVSKDDKPFESKLANERGEVVFEKLALGESQFLVTCEGFLRLKLALVATPTQTVHKVTLKIGPVVMGIFLSPEAGGKTKRRK